MKFSHRRAHAQAAWSRWLDVHSVGRKSLEANEAVRVAFEAGIHMGIEIAERGLEIPQSEPTAGDLDDLKAKLSFVDPEPWRYALIEGFNGRAAAQETGGFVYDPRTFEQYNRETRPQIAVDKA